MREETKILSLGDRGLDLVLGGGLRWFERVKGKAGSVLLIRGPAGAGKTLCALHAAIALGRALDGAIGYACVELFPSEVHEQARSVFGPAESETILARLLDLPERAKSLGTAMEQFWNSFSSAERRPKVVVLDSLISGYGLGADVDREIADAVCKFAAHWNVALVLVEEAVANAPPSPWAYAADTVLELSAPTEDVDAGRPAPFERRLVVAKHRFGPSDAGPHRFLIEATEGIHVLPRPSAWLEPWGVAEVRESIRVPDNVRLSFPDGSGVTLPISAATMAGPVVLVNGPDPFVVGETAHSARSESAIKLDVSFTRPLGEHSYQGSDAKIGLGHPYLSANRLIRVLLDIVGQESRQRGGVSLVRIGDLSVLRAMPNPAALLSAIGSFCALARAVRLPVVLYETTVPTLGYVSTPVSRPMVFRAPGVERPAATAFADFVIELRDEAKGGVAPVSISQQS